MTAEEKILSTGPASTSVIDLPAAPYCVRGEKPNLYNAAVEMHYLKGMIDYGTLHLLDNKNEEVCFESSQTGCELRVRFADIRFILFPQELEMQNSGH